MKKLKQQIIKEYQAEADHIEKEVNQLPTPPEIDAIDKDGLYAKIRASIADGQSPEKTAVRGEDGRVVPFKEPLRYRVGKWVAIVAIAMVGIFGVTMTSQANRAYFVETVEHVVGGKSSLDVVNQDDVLQRSDDEVSARNEIEEKLGVEVPKFYYLPSRMKFDSYLVDEEAQIGLMYYSYIDEIFVLQILAQTKPALSNYSTQGDKLETVEMKHCETSAEIFEQKNMNPDSTNYTAQWKYHNSFYIFSGIMNKDAFIKIIKKINY